MGTIPQKKDRISYLKARVTEEQLRRVKVHCASTGITVQDFVAAALNRALAVPSSTNSAHRKA